MRHKKRLVVYVFSLMMAVCMCLGLVACGDTCNHQWEEATCTTPKTCMLCGKMEGSALGHTGGTATCTEKAVCSVCHEEYGELDESNHTGAVKWFKRADGHYQGYDCCGAVASQKEPHRNVGGVCEVCGFDPSISMSDTSAYAGDTQVTVVVSVTDNPGIIGLELSLSYDEQIMTLTSASGGEALGDLLFTAPDSLSSGCKFLWDGLEISDRNVKDGELLVLSFQIADDAADGEYIIFMKAKAYDSDLALLSFKINDGILTVASENDQQEKGAN